MSKTKRSHHRNEEHKVDESDNQQSEQSNVSEDGGQTAEHKKRHRKKSSKKAKKHRSKQKRSHSQSNSDNSSDSDASSNEEEVIKRKKQKKHKKSKRRPAGSGSDNDDEVKIVAKPVKVHYVSDGEEDRNIDRNPKRLDERKRHAEPLNEDRHEYKSKWDSPKHDLERGKYRGDDRMYRDARVEGSRERSRHVQQAPPPFPRQRFPDERERFDRRNDDQEYRHREQPTGPKLEKPDAPDRFRRNDYSRPERERSPERERKTRFDDSRNSVRHENERNKSISPRRDVNRGRGNGREREDRRPNNYERPRSNDRQRNDFGRRDRSNDRQPRNDWPNDRPPRYDGQRKERSNERQMRAEPNRREYNDRESKRSNSPRNRNFSHQRGNDYQANRPNPFRRNRDEERSDFRPDEDRPYRNDDQKVKRDRNSPVERAEHRERPSRFDRKRQAKEADNEEYEWGKATEKDSKETIEPVADKEKPNFGLSGKLTEDANKVNDVILKYAEPPEARRPKRRWRLYPFKGDQSLQTLHIHRQSCYLIGREKKICDIAVEHPSCSKQHAVLQFRLVPYERSDGTAGQRVRPYILDLESSNGTFLNNKPIEPKKYVELMERDLIKFGFSTREYVLLHEDSHIDEEFDENNYESDHIKTEN